MAYTPAPDFIPTKEQEILQILKKLLRHRFYNTMEQWQLCSDDRIQIMGSEL